MPEESVSIGLRELIGLMASEVARKVTDELRANHIEPLWAEVNALKLKMAAPSQISQSNNLMLTRWKGAFDAIWKAGVVIVALIQTYRLLFQK